VTLYFSINYIYIAKHTSL